MVDPVLVTAPTTLWRVGRVLPDPLSFSTLSAEDAASPRKGNRFDVLDAGVLYAATDSAGCFAETLAHLRPTAAMRAIRAESDEHLMEVGAVAADWRVRRALVSFGLADPLQFLDVDAPATHTYLTQALADELVVLAIDNLDVAITRGNNRLLTRAIAAWAFAAVDDAGARRFAGIRYGSRLGPYECWAIFEGATIVNRVENAIPKADAALLVFANDFGLTVH